MPREIKMEPPTSRYLVLQVWSITRTLTVNISSYLYTTILIPLGCPIMNPQASLRVGNQLRATLLLQDINMIEALSHLTHERIPERYF
jgi:catalase